jgi:hypothetical protein
MHLKRKRGTTSLRTKLFIRDPYDPEGNGLSGLTASSGLLCRYIRDDQLTSTAVTLQSATVGNYTSGGFVEVPDMPGVYEFGIPDGALASGTQVLIMIHGLVDVPPVSLNIELDGVDHQDGTAMGLSNVPASLVATGLNNIPVTDPGPPANHTTLAKQIVAIYRRHYGKVTLTSTSLKTYKDDGVTVNSSQSMSDDGITESQGQAS